LPKYISYNGVKSKILNDLYWNQRLTTREIAQMYNVNFSTILNWMKKFRIPRRKGGSTILIPLNPTKELGYLCGVMLGDGYLAYGNHNYWLRLDTPDKELINEFIKAINQISPKLRPHIQQRQKTRTFPNGYLCDKPYFRLSFNSKILYEALRPYKQKGYLWQIPQFLTTNESLIGFLQGIWDSEGTINIQSNSGNEISMSSKYKSNLEQVKKLLAKFNVQGRIYHVKTQGRYDLRIKGYWNLLSFQKQINFRIPQKRRKLAEAIKQTIKPHWQEQEINYLKENYHKMTDKELAKHLPLRSWLAVSRQRLKLGLRKMRR